MSLAQHIKAVLEASGKKSLAGLIASFEFGKMIVDGNMGHAHLIRSGDGKLIGTDYHGNRYYENNETAMYTRRRFVVFSDKFDYNITSVPPEWHGWLNYMNDFEPTKHDFKKPVYQIEAYITKTGTLDAYNPKGSWFNPEQRTWKKYQAWAPVNSIGIAKPSSQ